MFTKIFMFLVFFVAPIFAQNKSYNATAADGKVAITPAEITQPRYNKIWAYFKEKPELQNKCYTFTFDKNDSVVGVVFAQNTQEKSKEQQPTAKKDTTIYWRMDNSGTVLISSDVDVRILPADLNFNEFTVVKGKKTIATMMFKKGNYINKKTKKPDKRYSPLLLDIREAIRKAVSNLHN